jgi:hypothetical protein
MVCLPMAMLLYLLYGAGNSFPVVSAGTGFVMEANNLPYVCHHILMHTMLLLWRFYALFPGI